MRVRARLWLLGAAAPLLGLLAAVAIGGQLFRLSQLRAVDQALLSQAAVESISLFDGPRGEPHLVLSPAQLETARPFAARGTVAVYESQGARLIRFPEAAEVPPTLRLPIPTGEPLLRDARDPDGAPIRELLLSVRSQAGPPFLLRLASPLGPVAQTLRSYYRVTLLACLVVGALLFLLQGWQARGLIGRIRIMTDFLPRLRDGDFGARLPAPDPTGDEIAELRAALVDAALRVKDARDIQERLIANAAHELRTPLTVMCTEMDLALRRVRSSDELREALSGARDEVDRLALLAARLLDLAALGRVERELRAGDLGELLHEAAEALRPEAALRQQEITVEAPAPAPARFDASALRQATDNYLANAIKFSPAGHPIRLRLRREPTRWVIEVSDEGPGVPPADRARVFEPFYRADTARPGTGLGLAIVREVAQRHGGEAWVGPSPSGGATFQLSLPLSP